jgi:hypothetical protein
MANSPSFAGTINSQNSTVSVANTNRNGTGTLVTSYTAGSSGSRVENIRFQARGTTTAGMIRIFRDNGTTVSLFKEYIVTAITATGTSLVFNLEVSNLAWLLAPGELLKTSTEKAETFNIFIEGGNF